MSTPEPQDLHSLAAAYVLDALSADEAADFARHLEHCDSCTLDVREMRETAAAMATSVAEQPPEGLRQRVLAQVVDLPQLGGADPSDPVDLAQRRRQPTHANRWLAGVAAAALIAAGALGVSTYQANQRADDAQVAADQLSSLLADPNAVVEHADATGGGSGTLVISPEEGRALFLAAGLPEPAADHTYQLWAIDESGATSVGLLEPAAGQARKLVDMPAGSTAFGVTVEPSGGSDQPTTKPVLLLELPA